MTQTSIFDDVTLDRVSVGDVIAALSHALDVTEGQAPGHALRCCLIGMAIGKKLGLTGDAAGDLYYTLLLKDLGCSSNAARICQLYLTDDQAFKAGFKTIGASTRQALAFVLRHTGPDETLASRIRTVADVLKNREAILTELFDTRCNQGAEIALMMGFSPFVAEAIAALDEHWDGSGRPLHLAREAIPPAAQIALCAQVIDVFQTGAGRTTALHEVAARSGTWFSPELARAAQSAMTDEVWDRLDAPDLARHVAAAQPAEDAWLMGEEMLDELVHGFARVIDAKSPFTHGHSARVALYADLICEAIGAPDRARRWIGRSALLHDIGKLGVSGRLLDKPARLTEEEFAVMAKHPALGARILSRIDVFAPMARVAEAHHERLDGRGYPNGLSDPEITWEMRVVTVADVFDALSAERPYCAALPLPEVWEIMEGGRGTAFDPVCLDALKSGIAAMPELGFSMNVKGLRDEVQIVLKCFESFSPCP